MRKVIVGARVSMDGVMQAPSGPDEEDQGFKLGGWAAALQSDDPVVWKELGKLFDQPFDLLLGRRTYDIFASYWPYAKGDIAEPFNRVTKYVATRKGVDLTWNVSVALRDAAKDVAMLKQEVGPPLITQGSAELVHSLLAAGLVDEIRTLTFPVLLGKGKRLFSDDSQPRAFKLTDSTVSPNGIIHAIYRLDGEVKTGTVGDPQELAAAKARRAKQKSKG
ncbi:MAG TPA: dihydrofolate reductase family protein [Thermoplasmata archaeon]|jgi:dihydrofolate reductase|nr:dihydrofolate reductase family protein [Thermoplasmata archaeon]